MCSAINISKAPNLVSISRSEDFDIKGKDSKCSWCGGDRLGGSTTDQEALNSKVGYDIFEDYLFNDFVLLK